MSASGEINITKVSSSQVNFSFCPISSIEAFDNRVKSDANQNQISPKTFIAPALVITPFHVPLKNLRLIDL